MSGVRPFFDTARELRRGQFLDDCADELQKVVAAVTDTGKSAKLTIELTVSPASKGGAILVADRINAKLPTDPPGETLLFATVENNLVASDPTQGSLPLKSVDADPAAGKLKEVS